MREKVITKRRESGVAVEVIGEGRESSDLIMREVMGGAGEGREGSGKLRRSEDPRHHALLINSLRRSVSQAHVKSIVGREFAKLGHLSFVIGVRVAFWRLDVNHEDLQHVWQTVGVDFRGRGCYLPWGKLVNEGCLKYEGESDTMYFDPDKWSYFVVVSVVKALGYDGFKDLWYSVGCGLVLDDKLEALCDDVGAMHMVNLANLSGQVHLYVVHIVSEPDVIHMIEYNVDEGDEEVALEMHEGGECAMLDERTEEDDGGGECERIKVDVGEGDIIEVDFGEGDSREDDEGHVEGDIVEVDEGGNVDVDEAHDDNIEANHVENKETWTWFMELLIEDLGGPELCSSLTLISNQQKGLLPTVQDLLPGVVHKFCARHLYANFRKKLPGKNLKKLIITPSAPLSLIFILCITYSHTTLRQQWYQELQVVKPGGVQRVSEKKSWQDYSKATFRCSMAKTMMTEVDEIVKKGFQEPSKGVSNETKKQYKENRRLDCKARMLLHQCISASIFQKVSKATTAKEFWDILQDGYGNSSKVKKVRLQSLQRQYELLCMGSRKRMQFLVNVMRSCRKIVKDKKFVAKILRTLTPQYDHITVAIEESKDLEKMKVEELLEVIKASEAEEQEEEEDGHAVAERVIEVQNPLNKLTKMMAVDRRRETTEEEESREEEVERVTIKEIKYGHYSSECLHNENAKKTNTDQANLTQDAGDSDSDLVMLMSVVRPYEDEEIWRLSEKECIYEHVLQPRATSHSDVCHCGTYHVLHLEKMGHAAKDEETEQVSSSNATEEETELMLPSYRTVAGEDWLSSYQTVAEEEVLPSNRKVYEEEMLYSNQTAHSDKEVQSLTQAGADEETERLLCFDRTDVNGENEWALLSGERGNHALDRCVELTYHVLLQSERNHGEDESSWYLDTRCSNHITRRREWLMNLDQRMRSSVKLADDNTVTAEGIGRILIKCKNGGVTYMDDVLYIPSVKYNLLSLGQLLEKGYTMKMQQRNIKVFDENQWLATTIQHLAVTNIRDERWKKKKKRSRHRKKEKQKWKSKRSIQRMKQKPKDGALKKDDGPTPVKLNMNRETHRSPLSGVETGEMLAERTKKKKVTWKVIWRVGCEKKNMANYEKGREEKLNERSTTLTPFCHWNPQIFTHTAQLLGYTILKNNNKILEPSNIHSHRSVIGLHHSVTHTTPRLGAPKGAGRPSSRLFAKLWRLGALCFAFFYLIMAPGRPRRGGLGATFADMAPYTYLKLPCNEGVIFLAAEARKHPFGPFGADIGQWELSFLLPWVSISSIFFHCNLKLSMIMES
ncbi:hypothetical protein V8G54_024814 [Vigna mungo]|uniref:Uncharacterized protein n=1 Tax=Vigna mungo TaxID=3915 RepID=A0AAQ3RSY5_VIGMU